MAFTRFHDDPARISKRLEESTYTGRYQLDRPGPGVDMPFFEEPRQRLQYWGANIQNNSIALESDLRGMTRKYHRRDPLETNDYQKHAVQTQPLALYSVAQPYVEDTRASHPAWMYRVFEPARWETPFLNPQATIETPFSQNIQTRILEKDKAMIP